MAAARSTCAPGGATAADVVPRLVGRVPWGAGGLPERFVPERPTSLATPGQPPLRRAPLRLRALVDGSALVATSGTAEHVLVHVAARQARRTVVAASGDLLDALPLIAGATLLLERDAGVRCVRPRGQTVWTTAAVGDRLLQRIDGTPVLVADGQRPSARTIDPQTGRLGERIEPPAPGSALFVAGNRLAFARDERGWALFDPGDGREELVGGAGAAWLAHGTPIGTDRHGRAYGIAADELARVARDGRIDWRVALSNVVLDARGRIAVSGSEPDGTLVVAAPRGTVRLPVDPGAGCRLAALLPGGALLVHCGATGRLHSFGADGRPWADRAAPASVWLAHDDLQRPGRDAVTPRGEVLVAVHRPDELAVVGLSQASTRS